MKLITSEKKVKDDFDLIRLEKEEDDLLLQQMELKYNQVAKQLNERFNSIVSEEEKENEQIVEEEYEDLPEVEQVQ